MALACRSMSKMVRETALSARRAAIAARDGAVLQLQTDAEARYERFDTLLATIKRAGITRLGFVGNERFGRW
jgi:biopolymer transport protein ExbD